MLAVLSSSVACGQTWIHLHSTHVAKVVDVTYRAFGRCRRFRLPGIGNPSHRRRGWWKQALCLAAMGVSSGCSLETCKSLLTSMAGCGRRVEDSIVNLVVVVMRPGCRSARQRRVSLGQSDQAGAGVLLMMARAMVLSFGGWMLLGEGDRRLPPSCWFCQGHLVGEELFPGSCRSEEEVVAMATAAEVRPA